jgi:hypothetical protein
MVLIPMAGLFPLGHRAVQKGRTISVSSALAQQAINQARAQFPTGLSATAPAVSRQVQTVEGVDYTVTTQLWPVAYPQSGGPLLLVDAVVDVSCNGDLPFEYTTRLSAYSADMQSP